MEKAKRVCLRDRDEKLLMFIGEYGLIKNENVKLLYQSNSYYKNRLASLSKGEYIERYNGYAYLGRKGKRFLNMMCTGYRNYNRDENYRRRMRIVSDMAAKLESYGWSFTPSWRCDVNTCTKKGNRYLGVLSRMSEEQYCSAEEFKKNSYIVYFIRKEHTKKQLRYINREIHKYVYGYMGIIIFVDDEKLLKQKEFNTVGFRDDYTMMYNETSLEILKEYLDPDFKFNIAKSSVTETVIEDKQWVYDVFHTESYGKTRYITVLPFINYFQIKGMNQRINEINAYMDSILIICFKHDYDFIRKAADERIEVQALEWETVKELLRYKRMLG